MGEAVEAEEWRAVPGFEGIYEVSSYGNVKSLPRKGAGGRILKPCTSYLGYCQYVLSKENVKTNWRGHVLVMLAFVGPRPDGMDIRHLDGDPGNNRRDNLAYGTRTENMQDALRHERHNNAHRTHCRRGHEFSDENTRIGTTGGRVCKSCQRDYMSAYYLARKAAANV